MFTKEELESGALKQVVARDENDNYLKKIIVDYTGEQLNPESGDVTTEMVIGVLAENFPEIVLSIAEENFVRGYEQGLTDSEHFLSVEKDDSRH